jgi:hypothetical protein
MLFNDTIYEIVLSHINEILKITQDDLSNVIAVNEEDFCGSCNNTSIFKDGERCWSCACWMCNKKYKLCICDYSVNFNNKKSNNKSKNKSTKNKVSKQKLASEIESSDSDLE